MGKQQSQELNFTEDTSQDLLFTEDTDLDLNFTESTSEVSKRGTSPDFGLSFGEALAFDATNFALQSQGFPTVNAPQTRMFSAINSMYKGLGSIVEGGIEATGALSDKIARNIVENMAAKGTLPYGLTEDQILAQMEKEDNPIYELGVKTGELIQEAFPENEKFQGEFLASVLPNAFGTLVGQVSLTAATGQLGGTAISAWSFSGLEYKNALDAGADKETAFSTFLLNLPVNSLEGLPVLASTRKLDKLTGGGVKKTLLKTAIGETIIKIGRKNVLGKTGKFLTTTKTGTGFAEGIQEVGQGFAQNLIAKNMYDETRNLSEGLSEGGKAGFILGFALKGIGLDLRRRIDDPDTSPHEKAESQNTLDYITRLDDYKNLAETMSVPKEIREDFDAGLVDAEGKPTAYAKQQADLRILDMTPNELDSYVNSLFTLVDGEPVLSKPLTAKNYYDIETLRNLQTEANLTEEFKNYDDTTLLTRFGNVLKSGINGKGLEAIESLYTLKTMHSVLKARGFNDETILAKSRASVGMSKSELEKIKSTINKVIKSNNQKYVKTEKKDFGGINFSELTKNVSAAEQLIEDITPEQSTIQNTDKPKTLVSRLEKWLAPRGFYPKPVREFFRSNTTVGPREIREMSIVSRNLQDALKTEFNIKRGNAFFSNKVPQEVQDNMNKVLTGQLDPSILPENLREPVLEMRAHVDRLSQMFTELGIVEGDLEIKFKENIGSYVHRTYKVHNNPDWKDIVEQDVINRAVAFIKSEYQDSGINLTDNQIERLINTLLDGETKPISMLRSGKIGSIDLSPLLRRKDIPEPIRALMGEETNAIVNYGKSIIAMTNYIDAQQTLVKLKDQFKGVYFFEDPISDPNAPPNATKLLAKDKNGPLGPLAGIYTTPEMKEALEDSFFNYQNMSRTHRGFLRLNAGAKFSKTVLNPVTIGRNVVGGMGFFIATGTIPSSQNFKQGFEVASQAFKNPRSKKAKEELLKLIDLKILTSSAKAGEIRDLIKDYSLSDNLDSTFETLIGGRGLFGKSKRALNTAAKFYQAGDDFNKVAMYYATLNKYQKADPNITEAEVARIVNDTYQNYDEAGNSKFIQGARRNLLIAPFLPFQYEVVRTMYNNVKLMKKEINSDNAGIRKIGYQRLAGMSFMGLGTLAAGMVSKALLGISDEEDDDVRRFAAPWDSRSTLIYTGINKSKGKATFFNLSYIDPYEYLKDPLINLMVNDSEDEFLKRVGNSLGKLLEPLIGTELFAQKLLEFGSNKTSQGGEVYNPQATLPQKTANVIDHFWDVFKPGFLDYAGNIVEASTDYRSDKTIPGQIGSLFGLRPVTVDFNKSLGFKARDYSKDIRDSKRLYNTEKFNESASILDQEKAFLQSNRAYKDIFDDFSRDIEGAYRMGLNWSDIEAILNDNGVSKSETKRLKTYNFKGFDR